MVSVGYLFRLIKSHLGLVSVNETSKSSLGLLLVSSWSHLGDHVGLIRSPFDLANDRPSNFAKAGRL
jgi:hypothetical protein